MKMVHNYKIKFHEIWEFIALKWFEPQTHNVIQCISLKFSDFFPSREILYFPFLISSYFIGTSRIPMPHTKV